jgi:tetratricopeptide (TPR) repeat protein
MRRSLSVTLIVAAGIFIAVLLYATLNRPSPTDYRLARGRALLETENYIEALEALREIPQGHSRAETHAYLGAAYLRLHLYKAAIREFEDAVKLSPRRADPLIGLASSHIELGEAVKAVEHAERATSVEPRSADAWVILGRAYWFRKSFFDAERAALKARELDAKNPAVSDLLLNVYFSQEENDKFRAELDRVTTPSRAIQDLAARFYVRYSEFSRAYDFKLRFERDGLARSVLESELALQREPAKMELYPDLIKNLVKVGRHEDAIAFARKYRGSIPLDLELGKAYWMTGRKDLAIQSYSRASAALVHKLSAEVALAAITGDVKHWEEAFRAERVEQDYFILAQLENVLAAASPQVRSFIFRYAGIYEPAFYNQAADEAVKVLDANPRDFHALMTIGTAYHRLGRIDDALRYMERAALDYPSSAEPVSRLANLALSGNEKDIAKVVRLMEQAVKLDPGNAGYLYNLGWLYDQTGDGNQAVHYYQRAIRSSPLTFEAMNNLALIYGQRGEPDRALPLLEQAIRTDPENEVGYFNLAEHYARNKDWKHALENYDRVLEINPRSAAGAIERGKILLETGRPQEAVEVLNRALEVDSHSFDAYVLLAAAYEKLGHAKESAAAKEEAQRIRPQEDVGK